MEKLIKNIPNLVKISSIISCLVGLLFLINNIFISICFYAYGAFSNNYKFDNIKNNVNNKLEIISNQVYILSLIIPSVILGNYLIVIPFILEETYFILKVCLDRKYNNGIKRKNILLFSTMILGLLAMIEPYLHLLFLPNFLITLRCQTKLVREYVKKKEENKCSCVIDNKNSIKKEKTIDKAIVKVKNKTKKLVRKKEYNDRY